jgi:hypothetical protein
MLKYCQLEMPGPRKPTKGKRTGTRPNWPYLTEIEWEQVSDCLGSKIDMGALGKASSM